MIRSGHKRDQAVAAAFSNARRHPRRAWGGGIQGYATGGGGSTSNSGSAPGSLFGYSPQFSQALGSMMGYPGFAPVSQTFAPQPMAPTYQAPIPASANIAASVPSQFIAPQWSGFQAISPDVAGITNAGGSALSNPTAGGEGIADAIMRNTASGTSGYPLGYLSAAVGTSPAAIPPSVPSPFAPPPAPAAPAASTAGATTPTETPEQLAADQAAAQAAAIANQSSSGGGQARGGSVRHYDTGGIAPGTINPTTPAAADPVVGQQIQQYATMPTEQLQQLSAMFGNSPRGQVINRVLQQKKMMPQQQIGAQQAKPAMPAPNTINPAAPMTPMAHGGRNALPHFDDGGAVGYLHGATPGRTDVLHIQPPGGSYVIPADVVSGLGEGNSLAGAAVLNKAFGMGPWNTAVPPGHRGSGVGIPRPPPTYGQFQREFAASLPRASIPQTQARGGKTEKGIGQPTPIIAASGEFILPPSVVRAIGGGDVKKGHDALDAFVLRKRKDTIDKMKKLQPPKK